MKEVNLPKGLFNALDKLSGAPRKVVERPFRAAFSDREWAYARLLYEWAEALNKGDQLMLEHLEICLEGLEDEAPEACRHWRERIEALSKWKRESA